MAERIVLTLSQEEANWLSIVMQNPLHDTHSSMEPQEDKKYRRAI